MEGWQAQQMEKIQTMAEQEAIELLKELAELLIELKRRNNDNGYINDMIQATSEAYVRIASYIGMQQIVVK